MITGVQVFDDVLPNPMRYWEAAQTLEFGDFEEFKGIAPCPFPQVPKWLSSKGLKPTLSFFRRSPEGQAEPNFIHTDINEGDWTAILYLTPNPPATDGTVFWRHQGGDFRGSAKSDMVEVGRWEPWQVIFADFGRLALFPSDFYHSRTIVGNYGEGPTARLIQVTFGVYQ